MGGDEFITLGIANSQGQIETVEKRLQTGDDKLHAQNTNSYKLPLSVSAATFYPKS